LSPATQRKRTSKASGTRPEPAPALLLELHRHMVRIRLFEEEAGRLMEASKIPGFLHLYVGQEAVAAGVVTALRDDDVITSTHRGHGHLVAKGGEFPKMFAELFGRSTGYCKGKGGSMHIADFDVGMLGANGIVGGGIPIATGAAFADRYRGLSTVAVSFFGDGATNIGTFHEALNFASLLQLPVVFVCENNLYAEYTPQARHQRVVDIAERAAGYSMPGVVVDGMDAVAVHDATVAAVERARSGGGPTFVEAKTYRYYDHSGVTGLRIPYRSDAEVEEWKARDPITSIEARIAAGGAATEDELEAVRTEVASEIAEAVAFAEASPYPDEDQLLVDVYTGGHDG
jgi:TPP-dependent pyruvate/acetoin dehydrogenase alpha subunit